VEEVGLEFVRLLGEVAREALSGVGAQHAHSIL
jgi:hypothetical protein